MPSDPAPGAQVAEQPRQPLPADEPARPRPPLVVDATELPEPAALVRAELERQLGVRLALAGRDEFAAEVERLEGAEQGLALRACVEAGEEYSRRAGERPGSLAWFAAAMAKRLGAPAGLGAPPPLPAPDPAWLESLGERRGKAEAQWQMAHDRVMRAAWPERRAELLAQELAGLVARFSEPKPAAGGAP